MSLSGVQTALRAGLFSLLKADGVLSGLLGPDRIFETPPRADAFPYLVLESMETRPLLTEIGEGMVHSLALSVFSRKLSRDEAAQAVGRAAEVLMAGPVSLTGKQACETSPIKRACSAAKLRRWAGGNRAIEFFKGGPPRPLT
ncbi:DUF3168 domain-containing protein [Roseibium alexandrii]|uniref:DUF3168 domain-containing protein n=1 Tax=Roseibium alexandrii TaxID=388408 RepID=UPI00375386D9